MLDTPSGKPKGQNERGEDAGVRQTPGLTTASRGPGRTEANSPDSCSPREEAPGLITGAKGVSRCTGLPVLSASDFPGAPAGKDPLVPARGTPSRFQEARGPDWLADYLNTFYL